MRLSDDGGREQESFLCFSCENTAQWGGCSEIWAVTLPVLTEPHLHSSPVCCTNRHHSHSTLPHSCGTKAAEM